MEMRRIKNGIYSVVCIAFLCGCMSDDANEVKIQERTWPELCEWLSSREDFTLKELSRVYDCSIEGGEVGSIMVSFLPWFGATTVFSGEGTTLYCSNMTTTFLPLKGFPSCCRGISLEGRFDLSKVNLKNSVEYFYLQDVECDEIDQIRAIPDFSAANNLKYLELAFLVGECKDWSRVLCLDAGLFAGHDKLRDIHLDIGGLVSHTEALLQSKVLRNIKVNSSIRIASGVVAPVNMEMCEESNESAGRACEYFVDDSSFDEFIKNDFSKLGRLDVRIKLSKMRVWDISSLVNCKLEELYIVSENCLITGMESLRQSTGLTDVGISMEVHLQAGEEGVAENQHLGKLRYSSGCPRRIRYGACRFEARGGL